VPLSRISWLLTVATCLVAAVLLLLNGYLGYFGVLLAVGAAAAVNLLQGPRSSGPPTERDAARRH
jgi:hypothetical protein